MHGDGKGQRCHSLGLAQLFLVRDSCRRGPELGHPLSCACGYLGDLGQLLNERVSKGIKS